MKIRDILIYFSIIYDGDFDLIYQAIKNKEQVDERTCEKTNKELKYKTITIIDNDYPIYFKVLSKPPFVIYYQGDKNLLYKNKRLSVVGSRKASTYGEKITKSLLKDVLEIEDVVIVSGLALGIDSFAHEIALKMNRGTIAVLANGIDSYYLKDNYALYNSIKENGLIISEYPPKVKITKEKFLLRNRLIAALSPTLFIPEAKNKSGSSITANYALELGKNIICVPKNIEIDSLCNTYIQQGAKLIMTADDILEEL